jgi:hypothetical protein
MTAPTTTGKTAAAATGNHQILDSNIPTRNRQRARCRKSVIPKPANIGDRASGNLHTASSEERHILQRQTSHG